MTGDSSALAAQRIGRASNPDDYVILPERISKEPLAPVVRHGDDQWHDIVDWTVYALIQAEESGITQANVDDMLKSDDPQHQAHARRHAGHGQGAWGSTRNGPITRSRWSAITARSSTATLGMGSPMKLERGLNNCGPRAAALRDADPLEAAPAARRRDDDERRSLPQHRPTRPAPWRDPKIRGIAYQIAFVAAVVGAWSRFSSTTCSAISAGRTSRPGSAFCTRRPRSASASR
jgi:hypothetical protein